MRRYRNGVSGGNYQVGITGNFEVAFDGEADLVRHMVMGTAAPDARVNERPAGPEHDRTRPRGGAWGQTGSAVTKGSSVPNQATSASMASAADASMMRLLRMAAIARSGSASTLSVSVPGTAAASAGVSRQRFAAASASISPNSASLARSNCPEGEPRERPRFSAPTIIWLLTRPVAAMTRTQI